MKTLLALLSFLAPVHADVLILSPDTVLFYDSAYVMEAIIGDSPCTVDSGVRAPCDCTQERPCYLSLDYGGLRHGPILHYVAAEGDLFTFGVEIPLWQHPARPDTATLAFYDWHNTLRGSRRVRMGYKEERPPVSIVARKGRAFKVTERVRVDGRRL